MPDTYILLSMLVTAAVTLLLRLLPFIIFRGNKPTPKIITHLGSYLPFATMAMLVVYCLKGTSVISYPYALPELISVVVVVGLHLWKRNTLFSIALGTICYMLLVQLVF